MERGRRYGRFGLGSFWLRIVWVPGSFRSRAISAPSSFGPWSFQSRVVSNRVISVQGHFSFESFLSRMVSVPGHFGPRSFWIGLCRFRVISVPSHFGHGSFRSMVVSVPGRFGSWSFRYQVVLVPGRLGPSFRTKSFRSPVMAVYVLPIYLPTYLPTYLPETCRPFWYIVWYSPTGQLDTLDGNDYVKFINKSF